jgi:hypothetical protein
MNIRIALFAGLILTLGTAMSADAIQAGAKARVDQQSESAVKVAAQTTPTSSRILVLPRPL